MNETKKKNEISLGTPGATSLMVIFAVLCLAVFSVLSLSTVLADIRLAESANESILASCKADAEAERILAELRDQKKNGEHEFSVPVSDTQHLQVRVSIDDETYTILQWRYVYSADWKPDESLAVWAGE